MASSTPALFAVEIRKAGSSDKVWPAGGAGPIRMPAASPVTGATSPSLIQSPLTCLTCLTCLKAAIVQLQLFIKYCL
jgi:hypothetical protein